MSLTTVVFFVFAAILVVSAVRVITARNPVHAALFLVLAFFNASGIWMILRAEFLAITLVLVYVGAVMVLFLFVVMMLDINVDVLRKGFRKNLPLALLVGGIVIVELAFVIWSALGKVTTAAPVQPADFNNTRELGKLVYTQYIFPFEIAAVLLLVAIIAAIALTLRGRKDSKHQVVGEQVATRRADRVHLVNVKSQRELPEPPPPEGARDPVSAPAGR
ncbi:NADH-quinone oxidoreductase subunit J [soil metagenome]